MKRLVVGLGNPGSRYERTRHNAGFRVVERVARLEGLIFRSGDRLEGFDGPGELELAHSPERGIALAKPQAFMNLSGAVVAPLLAWLEVEPPGCLVVYDDLDLPLGTLRIRPHGGAGTHNGMRSLLDHLATDRFPRLRVGIGAAATDAARHVLEEFTPAEEKLVAVAVEEAAAAVRFWLDGGDIDACMTRFHSRWNQGA